MSGGDACFEAPKVSCRCEGSLPDEVRTLDVEKVLQVDALLVSSRHMFRMAYSLHEKSGLVSLPIDPARILEFDRDEARPERVSCERVFLRGDVRRGEAARLVTEALDYTVSEFGEGARSGAVVVFDLPEHALPEEAFPPCMQAMLAGLGDGRKRALFAMTNLLRGAGWSGEQIEARLREWNAKNKEPLREVDLKSHLRYHGGRKAAVPPPGCKSFYQDLGVCRPDALCAHIRNPLAYVKRKAGSGKKPRKKA
ncbi:MAG: hypothetical protein HC945_01340 [Nitrosarchaeum sp.]|nr:hypothetical protein [Nitrosarchaeum sp.]